MVLNGRWRVLGTMPQVFFAYNEQLQRNNLPYFNVTKNNMPPDTIISTAVLQETTFVHNDLTVECFFLPTMTGLTETIRVAGSLTLYRL